MDIFFEFIVKKKKEMVDYLISAGIVIAAMVLSMAAFMLTIIFSKYLSGLGLVFIFLIWWGAWTLIRSDYSKESERLRVLFQPNERILSGLKKANPRLVAVKEGDI